MLTFCHHNPVHGVKITTRRDKMKALQSLVLLSVALFLVIEGGNVSTSDNGGNVYINVGIKDSKQMLGLLKTIDNKLNEIIQNMANTNHSCKNAGS
jgi:hypothetical protein